MVFRVFVGISYFFVQFCRGNINIIKAVPNELQAKSHHYRAFAVPASSRFISKREAIDDFQETEA